MTDNVRDLLKISTSVVDEINALLLDPNNRAVNAFLEVVQKYGTPEEINRTDFTPPGVACFMSH